MTSGLGTETVYSGFSGGIGAS